MVVCRARVGHVSGFATANRRELKQSCSCIVQTGCVPESCIIVSEAENNLFTAFAYEIIELATGCHTWLRSEQLSLCHFLT